MCVSIAAIIPRMGYTITDSAAAAQSFVNEQYSEFRRSGATYAPLPSTRNHRMKLADIAKLEEQATLFAIWIDPTDWDRASARGTPQVTNHAI
jgi:hypothetical protein